MVYAIDFEADYSSEYGIEEVGLYHYLHDARFNPYLLSIWGEDIQWVGNPKDCPHYDALLAADTLVAHNSSFDRQVWTRCVELGIIPFEWTKAWRCTANLSVFLGGPRSLKDAAKYLLGVELSKEMRNYMKGRTWEQAVAEGKSEQLKQYALDDSKYCYGLWKKYSDRWPAEEQLCAEITHLQTVRGITVDIPLLDIALPKVVNARDDALAKIPWAGTVDSKGGELKPLSSLALKQWCKDSGIVPPTTTEAKNPEFMKWQEANKDVSVIKAMQTYRSANALALKGQTLRRQVRPDGRYGFAMKYYGATTGRWSAGYEDERNDSSGLNIQNLIKDEMYGLNLRKAFIAAPGKKFVISDYSNIEPRCLAWLCDDRVLLTALGNGMPIYEAHARASMGWTGGVLKKENPKVYSLAKARCLALGYGSGWAKFIFMAKMYGAGECLLAPVTASQTTDFKRYIARTRQQDKLEELKTEQDWTEAVNSWLAVTDFRRTNPLIAGRNGLWKKVEMDCMRCTGTDYKVELPSGRILPYFNVNTVGGLTAQKQLHVAPIRVFGAFLVENICQATARDVMRDAILRLEAEGIETLFTVHDEIVCEVDRNFDKNIIREIMNQTPAWMPGLPLEIEQEECEYYKK